MSDKDQTKTTADLTDLQIAQEQCDEWQAACRNLERINAEQRAEIERLRAELRDVLSWAITERAPLRQQEIDSIREALNG